MHTPWFVSLYIYDYAKEIILNEINRYEYFENGIIYNAQKNI